LGVASSIGNVSGGAVGSIWGIQSVDDDEEDVNDGVVGGGTGGYFRVPNCFNIGGLSKTRPLG